MLTSIGECSTGDLKISYLIVLHSVGGVVLMMFTHLMLRFKCRMADYYALYTTVHYYTLSTVIYMKSSFHIIQVYCKGTTPAISA
jgi:hypothetical protein